MIFTFDSLLKLDSVMVVKNHQLYVLLKIILQDGIQEYRQWLEANEGILSEFGMYGVLPLSVPIAGLISLSNRIG